MHEVEMQRLFKDDQMIRPMVDFVPSSEPGGPLMILKPFEQTLWEARNTRPFSVPEIKWIMKGVLLGLYTVHMKDLVYTDLKMENVGMQGFENDRPNENIRNLIVRLSDCGAISKPSQREVTSLTYRSPEIHFGKSWSQTCDIWSWGIIVNIASNITKLR
ncbi:serine/threonine protein kinase [Histoplasma ohiense]|nr:serine/threonine protein kinase [Histoplasma ohiense (nom. inval.)]